jgi:hypothetical protein
MDKLHRMNDHFEEFLPETVKHLIASDPGAPQLSMPTCNASVLFLDIHGYTRQLQPMPPLNALVEGCFPTENIALRVPWHCLEFLSTVGNARICEVHCLGYSSPLAHDNRG